MLTLLRDVDLFAPDPLGRADLLIAGERVVYAGAPLAELPPSWLRDLPIETRSLGGRRVVPGLIDLHAHLTGGGGEASFKSRLPRLSYAALVRAGVTSVVGLLGTDDITRSPADLLACARALDEHGLTARCWTGGYHVPPRTLLGSVFDDIVLIDAVIGAGEIALSDHRSSQPTQSEIEKLAAQCHVAGLLSGKAGLLHLHLGDGPRGLSMIRDILATTELPPRTFHPTHVNRRRVLFDEALGLAQHGVPIDITAFPVSDGEDALSAADALECYWGAGAPASAATVSSDCGGSLPIFDAAGQLIHYGVAQPSALIETVRELVDRGHPLERVLAPFTVNVAALLRWPRKGRLAAGMDADLVVLDEHGGVHSVMARGRWHLEAGVLSGHAYLGEGDHSS